MSTEPVRDEVTKIRKIRVGMALDELLDALDAKDLPGAKPKHKGQHSLASMLASRFQRRKKPEEKRW